VSPDNRVDHGLSLGKIRRADDGKFTEWIAGHFQPVGRKSRVNSCFFGSAIGFFTIAVVGISRLHVLDELATLVGMKQVLSAVLAALFVVHPLASPLSNASGDLVVASDPQDAGVYVDGRFAGQTPVTLTRLAAGDHRVRLVKDGFLENVRVVSVAVARRASLHIALTPQRTLKGATGQVEIGRGENPEPRPKWPWIVAGAAGAGEMQRVRFVGGERAVSLPLVANQQWDEALAGGAREQAAEQRVAGPAFGSAGATHATGTNRSPASTTDGATIADALSMNTTTSSSSSSSQ